MNKDFIVKVKKNYFNYKIIEVFISGIVLNGDEIKSIRNHKVSINEAYISFDKKEEIYVFDMKISSYRYSGNFNSNNLIRRKLLLNKKEIRRIIKYSKVKKYPIIPLKLFLSDGGWAKLEIAISQRLKKYQIKKKIKDKNERFEEEF